MLTVPVLLSLAAFCISCVALWKSHFAPFSPLVLANNLQLRIYPIRNEDDTWFIPSFDLHVSVTNPGARPGVVTGLRLRLQYPELPLDGNHEFFHPVWELKADKVKSINEHRFVWINEVVSGIWSPFAILPKATVVKHLLFESRWDRPVIQKRVLATLEIQSNWSAKWLSVNDWQLQLAPKTWVDLVSGHGILYQPAKFQASRLECSPPDLHNYTGTKFPLPEEGIISAAAPSYLNYPERKS